MPVTITTGLPDEDQPVLGNGVEDEVSVDRESAPTNYGDVRIQIRETGQSSWDSNATGFSEFVGAYNTLTMEFVGREDGEEYEVRARTETEHVTGAWTTPVAITTQFPGATGVTVSNVGKTSADLSWTDNSDNEDGFDVERAKHYDSGWGPWRTVAQLAPNTTSHTDDTVQPGREYRWRVKAYTEHTEAYSGTVSTTTSSSGVRQQRIPARGWYVEIDHPTADVTLRPTVLDSPTPKQTINGLPKLDIPVPRDETWLADAFEDAPLRAWKDGQRQPVETLVETRVTESETVLTARGGEDLLERVRTSYQFEDVDVAVRDLVTNNTTLTPNVDDPASNVDEVLMQDVDSQTEWEGALAAYPFPDDDPRYIDSGQLKTHPTALFRHGETPDSETGWSNFFADRYESGETLRTDMTAANVSSFTATWTVQTNYTIPASDVGVFFRLEYFDDTHPGFEVRLNGEVLYSVSADQDFVTGISMPAWFDNTTDYSTDLAAGSHDITIEATTQASDDSYLYIDAVALVDKRHTETMFQEDLSSGGFLEWPHQHPTAIQTETEDAQALNKVVGGRMDVQMDTTNNQALALSNDQGGSWPISASNATTVDGSFASGSGQIRGRFTQSYRDSGSGPVVYDAGQPIDLYELYADQEDTPVLIDRAFDGRLLDILTTIAEDKNSVFEVRYSDANGWTLEWTQPGQRTSDDDASVVAYDIVRDTGSVVEKAVIKGGTEPIVGESVTASHGSWVSLDKDDLIEGREAVKDASSGQQFVRGEDYELDYLDGRIKTLSTGAISDGASLLVDYEYKPQASYTLPGASDPKTIVEHVPAIHSEQTARQLAYYIVQEAGTAIYEGQLIVDRQPAGWSLIDAIDPEQVPTSGEVLQIRDIETTAGKVTLSLASRQSVGEIFNQVKQRLSRAETKI